MPITLNGSTGIVSDGSISANGSAAAPSFRGADTASGVFFPTTGVVAVSTGGTEKMRVDASGFVTAPNQPVFWAWNGQGGTTGLTSSALITFSLTDLNIGNHYSTSTGRFTAPVTGLYQFNCMALFRANNSTQSAELTFYKNGVNISARYLAYASASGQDHLCLHIQTYLSLSAGDFVQPYALVNSGVNFYLVERLSWFCGRLMS